jgi:hypothetical protein
MTSRKTDDQLATPGLAPCMVMQGGPHPECAVKMINMDVALVSLSSSSTNSIHYSCPNHKIMTRYNAWNIDKASVPLPWLAIVSKLIEPSCRCMSLSCH